MVKNLAVRRDRAERLSGVLAGVRILVLGCLFQRFAASSLDIGRVSLPERQRHAQRHQCPNVHIDRLQCARKTARRHKAMSQGDGEYKAKHATMA